METITKQVGEEQNLGAEMWDLGELNLGQSDVDMLQPKPLEQNLGEFNPDQPNASQPNVDEVEERYVPTFLTPSESRLGEGGASAKSSSVAAGLSGTARANGTVGAAKMTTLNEAVVGMNNTAIGRTGHFAQKEKRNADTAWRSATERRIASLAKILTRRKGENSSPDLNNFAEIQTDVSDWVRQHNQEVDEAKPLPTERPRLVEQKQKAPMMASPAPRSNSAVLKRYINITSPAPHTVDLTNFEAEVDEPVVDKVERVSMKTNDNAEHKESEVNDFEAYEREVYFWSNEYNSTEQQFAKYQETAKNQANYAENLRHFEDDQAYNWRQLSDGIAQAQNKGVINNIYELARAERLGTVEPNETIEAASGLFYHGRALELQKAIQAGNSETAEAELALIGQTLSKVSEYMIASSDYESKRWDLDYYKAQRNSTHNSMIRQLNNLNDLAEKYETQRFTLRNFMTNEFRYLQKLDPGSHLNHRAEYDRETVLAYFQTAFSQDFAKMQRELGEN